MGSFVSRQAPEGASGSRAASLRHMFLSVLSGSPQLGKTPTCTASLLKLERISWSSRVMSCGRARGRSVPVLCSKDAEVRRPTT
jgi:hypothetical protein